MVFSLFVVAPASQAASTEGANIAIRPVAGTTFAGTTVEDFQIYAQLLPGQSNSSFSSRLYWKVEKTSGTGMEVIYNTAGAGAVNLASVTSVSADVDLVGAAQTSRSFAATVSSETGLAYLSLKASSASGVASWSSVTLTVTAWIDEVTQGSSAGAWDADEWYTTETITLYNPTALTGQVSFGSPQAGNVWVTASATLGQSLNFLNLTGKFMLAFSSSNATLYDGTDQQKIAGNIGQGTMALRAGVVSSSLAIAGLTTSDSISGILRYVPTGAGTAYTDGYAVGTVVSLAASSIGLTTLTTSAVVGDDVIGGGVAYDVRQNKTYTVKVHASTNSASISGQAISLTLTGTGLVTSSREISFNGAALTTNYPTGVTITTGADGYASFTLRTTGFVAGNFVTVSALVGDAVVATDVQLTARAETYTMAGDYSNYLTSPGTAVTLGYTIEDQWGVASARTDQYVKVTRGGTGFSYATTVSYVPVVSGAAAFSFVPEAATTTGSASVGASLVRLADGAYVADGSSTDTTAVIVSSVANSFGAGLAASRASTVSYFPSTVSWVTVTGAVANTGSSVVVTGNSNLVFRASAALATTYSGGITVRAGSAGAYTFQVASLKAGDQVITLTNGSASTTSIIAVADAAYNSGATITFDTEAIDAGKTLIVTGTLVDANGNPVATGDTASITVTYAGTAGIPVGSMPTSTDAAGQFKVSILTSAADKGTFTLTAVYRKDGASTATRALVTKVQSITVGAVESDSADQKVNAGSFKGYVAVYAKGYEGQRLSAKIGNDWVVVESLASNFERVVDFTGAGYTIAVRIYIDRVLVDTITVTTK